MATIILLTISNLFMTIAWYGHLKFKDTLMWKVILASWFIAFFEYCFQVPANRIGHDKGYTLVQLKTIQEVLSLSVFAVYAVVWYREKLQWNHALAFVFLVAAVYLVFHGRK